jgi:hypothetical protein
MLPGATPPTEELILGDDQGNGILDEMQPESEAPITPRNDPFAYRPGQTGSLRR